MTIFHSPDDLVPLKEWCNNLNKVYVDWTTVFESLFYRTTNNFKLVQFQYKVLMRISTCRYMRYKMKIEKHSPNCSLWQSSLETLPHIFLQCSHTVMFKSRLNAFISLKLDHHYRDRNNYYFITCNHDNSIINYVNMVSKWYISKQFQNQQSLDWLGFKRWVKLIMIGEKPSVKIAIEEAGLLAWFDFKLVSLFSHPVNPFNLNTMLCHSPLKSLCSCPFCVLLDLPVEVFIHPFNSWLFLVSFLRFHLLLGLTFFILCYRVSPHWLGPHCP